jgi:hypothetical protein
VRGVADRWLLCYTAFSSALVAVLGSVLTQPIASLS